MVLVGDRGMISQKLIDEELRDLAGVDWITADWPGELILQHFREHRGLDGVDADTQQADN